ncbi:MAG: hypothetical protein J6V72_12110 [Kiritimatiellae bacterium]|nr:hypothetical protein [Kiritimatiellia bacterium]
MTVKDVTERARQIAEDTVEPYRYDDAAVQGYIGLALQQLNLAVPSTRYVDGQLTDYTEVPPSPSDTIAVHQKYLEALAMYVAGQCYLNDATDTVNGTRADACLARAMALMK